MEKADLAVSPGIGFGEYGEGFVRIALVENEQRIRQAARNVGRFLEIRAGATAQRRSARHGGASSYDPASESRRRRIGHGRRRPDRPGAARADALAARCGRAIEIVAICARSRAKERGVDLKRMKWFADPVALARAEGIDVFVELMGGAGDPAKSAVEAALASGKSVVTANKALLAKHGVKLAALAEKHHVALNFEAAVGGAIPIVKTLREGLAGNSFERIYGILNGTCNYILTRMEQEKMAFAECLKDAQRLGYAEADPSFDIEGHDTAQKLAILASLAFGTKVDQSAIYVEGISVDFPGRPLRRR